jgi:hypothetical protein
MAGDPRELGGDLGRGQDDVDGSCEHRAVRHAGVLRRSLVLGERHAPCSLDRAKADRAVGSGARENHADRSGSLVVGQGRQEGVDRQVLAVGVVSRSKAQDPARYRQAVVRWNDVDVIGPDRRAVLDLAGRHGGHPGEQVCQDRLVRRVKMLHQHEGHAGVVRQRPKKLGEGLEATRGGAEAHDRETRRRPCLLAGVTAAAVGRTRS